uniref:Uncharacterized protein n=2 Tax=Lygus hesperus TaxID=30085 RepID=A0A146LP72_LYGHE
MDSITVERKLGTAICGGLHPSDSTNPHSLGPFTWTVCNLDISVRSTTRVEHIALIQRVEGCLCLLSRDQLWCSSTVTFTPAPTDAAVLKPSIHVPQSDIVAMVEDGGLEMYTSVQEIKKRIRNLEIHYLVGYGVDCASMRSAADPRWRWRRTLKSIQLLRRRNCVDVLRTISVPR